MRYNLAPLSCPWEPGNILPGRCVVLKTATSPIGQIESYNAYFWEFCAMRAAQADGIRLQTRAVKLKTTGLRPQRFAGVWAMIVDSPNPVPGQPRALSGVFMSQATCAGSHHPQSLGRMTTSQGGTRQSCSHHPKKYPGPHVITRPGVPRQGYCAGPAPFTTLLPARRPFRGKTPEGPLTYIAARSRPTR